MINKIQLPTADGDTRLSKPRLFAIAFLGLPLAGVIMPISIFLPPFYAAQFGLSLAVTGPIFMFARFWDVFTDPIMGYVSDRYPSRFGRRRHWILLGTPILCSGVFFLFNPTFFFENVSGYYLFFTLFVLYIGWTLVTLNHYSWASEVHSAYHERSRVQGALQALTIVGLIIAIVIPEIVKRLGYDSATQIGAIGWYLVIAMPLAALMAVYFVPEQKRFAQKLNENSLSWKEAIFTVWRNAPLRRLIIVFVLEGFLTGTIASLFLFFATYALGLEEQRYLLLFVYFLSGAAGMQIWMKLSYRIGKHRALVASLVYTASVIWLMLLIPYGNALIAFPIFVLAGANFGSINFILRSIMGDVTDHDEVESGEQRTGLYFSFFTLTNKIGLSIPIGTIYPLLTYVGFAHGGENSESAIGALRIIYISVPVIFSLLMALVMWNFPLDEETHSDLRRKLDARDKSNDKLPNPGAVPVFTELEEKPEASN